MSIKDQISADIKSAMLSKEKDKLEALRAIKAAFMLVSTQKGASADLADVDAIKTIQKLVKQREDSAQIYLDQNRKDLADLEISQAGFMKPYLPKQLSDDEILETLNSLISQTGAQNMSDFGKVMGMASKQLSGKADGKKISALLKPLLS